MEQWGASERVVRDALAELQRQGRIVRKSRVGTFVADPRRVHSVWANNTIFAISSPDQSFFDTCIEALYRHCEPAGLGLVCQPVQLGQEDRVLASASGGKACGYLLFGYRWAPLAKRLRDAGEKVVLVGAPPISEIPDFPCVYNDHEHGGYLVARHLIELGHQRIGFNPMGCLDLFSQRRWSGHMRAISEARALEP